MSVVFAEFIVVISTGSVLRGKINKIEIQLE